MPEKKKGKSILDALFPVVDDDKPGTETSEKEGPTPEQSSTTVTPKKRSVPGSAVSDAAAPSQSSIVMPISTNAEVEVFYKSILERVSSAGVDYVKFQGLLTQFSPMFPGAEDKAIAAAVIAMGDKGSNAVVAAIDERLKTLADLSAIFEQETAAKMAELSDQEKSLPSVDKDVAGINQQIAELQRQVAEQVAALQKRIDALNQQKGILAKQVQEGRAKVSSAQNSFATAIGRAKTELEVIKSKIPTR